MPRVTPELDFKDERGSIKDLLPPGDYGPPTEIFTRAGSVRGNHYHCHTTQWVYVVYGLLAVRWRDKFDDEYDAVLIRGDLFMDPPGIPHAWEALEDTLVLVLTQGPRSGKNYETDTIRLEVPLIEP